MKHAKSNIASDLENRILLCCFGIAILVILFYYIYKISQKTVEGLGLIMSEGPFDMTGMVTPLVNANADMNFVFTTLEIEEAKIEEELIMEADTLAIIETDIADTALSNEVTMTVGEAEIEMDMHEGTATRRAELTKSLNDKAIGRVNNIVGIAGSAVDIAAAQAATTASNAANVQTYFKQADWNSKMVNMFSHFWKFGLIGFLMASGVGSWAITNINVLIYRIMNFKTCFFWYILEVIGWVIYLPIEFLVWLFSMQEAEKVLWKGLDYFDCAIYDFVGFYLFKHSDEVNKKCYSQVFTPFPEVKAPINFNDVGNYMNQVIDETQQLTSTYGNLDDVQQNVDNAVKDAQQAQETSNALQSTQIAITGAEIAVETAEFLIP